MIKNKKVLVNIITSGGQVVLVGLIVFFLYRFLLRKLGVELLGVWSIVLATSSLANLANFGITSSIVRFVALYAAGNEVEKIKRLIFTSSVFLLTLFTLLSIIILPFASIILSHIIPSKYLQLAIGLLPYSIACLIINAIAGVYTSVLDGLQKNYVRSAIITSSSLLFLLTAYLLVSKNGLRGVAIAQLSQSVFTGFFSLLFVIRAIKHNPLRWRWESIIFKEIFSYGLKFQAISIFAMLADPFTKTFLAKYGGLAFAGYYEMANKLVMQVRSVVVSANQSLLPVLIDLSTKKDDGWIWFYKKTFYSVFMFSLFFMAQVYFGSSIFSQIWIGHIEPVFLNIILLLAFATFINLLASPAYFYFMADAKLNPIILSQVTASITNVSFAFLFGTLWGGNGVIVASALSMIIATFIIIQKFHKTKGMNFLLLLRGNNIKKFSIISLLLLAIKLAASKFYFYHSYKLDLSLIVSISIAYLVFYEKKLTNEVF